MRWVAMEAVQANQHADGRRTKAQKGGAQAIYRQNDHHVRMSTCSEGDGPDETTTRSHLASSPRRDSSGPVKSSRPAKQPFASRLVPNEECRRCQTPQRQQQKQRPYTLERVRGGGGREMTPLLCSCGGRDHLVGCSCVPSRGRRATVAAPITSLCTPRTHRTRSCHPFCTARLPRSRLSLSFSVRAMRCAVV